MRKTIKQNLYEVTKNFNSLHWWKSTVFVPYVLGSLTRLHPTYPGYSEGIRVTEKDWDNLIILDACRSDAFERVADLDVYDQYESVISLGSHSSEWTKKNFSGEDFGDIVYISANPHTSRDASDSFHKILELWDSDFDADLGTVPAEKVVDKTKMMNKKHPNKKLIIHFMQPHSPFIGSTLSKKEISDIEQYKKAYDDNLKYVLQHAHKVIDEIQGKSVISSDHGQIYPTPLRRKLAINGHRSKLRHPKLVRVPWAVINGERRDIIAEETTKTVSENINTRLRDLGYKV